MQSHRKLFLAQQVRTLDREAAKAMGVTGFALMSRAGAAAFRLLCAYEEAPHSIVVICGTGNNAGDGYVLGRLALEAGLRCRVLFVGGRDRLKGDALRAAEAFRAAGGTERPFDAGELAHADVVVDALLGIGVDRPLTGEWKAAVEAVNAAGAPVLSLDLPSGLNADNGEVMGVCIRARRTVSFVGLKRGSFTGRGPDYCGSVTLDTLGAPESLFEGAPHVERMAADDLKHGLPRRERNAHKGCFGRVLVVGGDRGYGGAARMAAEAALRTGAGLVSLAVREAYVAAFTAVRPELMCHGVRSGEDLEGLLDDADVVAVGPGLRRGDWGRALWAAVLASGKLLVVDADALHLLAEAPEQRGDWILTPHPGEAARLLGVSNVQVQADRFAAVEALVERYGGVGVLKGAGTLVAGRGGAIRVCPFGNPGMAAAGMGDVLTGVIAGLLAQGVSRFEAAGLGVLAHALAGDRAARDGQRGLSAMDVVACLRRVVNKDA